MSDGLDHLHADIRRSVADFPATVRCAILSSLLVGPAPRATKAEAEKRHEKRNTEQHLNGSMIAKTCCCFLFLPSWTKSSVYPYVLRTGDALSSVEISVAALGGALIAPSSTMSLAPISFPYRFLFASLSGRNVEPSSETPANAPFAREYVRI